MEHVEFADPTGTLWHPHMTYATMKTVFRKTGIRLWVEAPTDTIEDPYLLCDMVYEAIREEAVERGVTPEAWRALWEEGPMMSMILGFQKAQAQFAFVGLNEEEAAERAARPTVPPTSGPTSGGSAH